MSVLKTNKLGKYIILIGFLVIVISFLISLNNGFNFFKKGFWIGNLIGLGIIFIGRFIRYIGMVLIPAGISIIIFTVLHIILLYILKINFLNFGIINLGAYQFLSILCGVFLFYIGKIFARSEDEEEHSSMQASQRAQHTSERQIAERERREVSIPRCPNCGAKAGGGAFAGNRLVQCLSCGTVFCGNCSKKTFGGHACPSCGESSQSKIRFR